MGIGIPIINGGNVAGDEPQFRSLWLPLNSKLYSGDLESIVGVRGGETSSKAVSFAHIESHWKVRWVGDKMSVDELCSR